MQVRVIAELGSCHMGKVAYGKEAIERCIDAGADAIKFQLFPNTEQYTKVGNVWLDPEKYLELSEYAFQCGLDCSASVFDDDSFEFLLKTAPPFIKFSYSQKNRVIDIGECLAQSIEPIVSCDVMTDKNYPKRVTKLFCLPLYPVYFSVNFDELFPRFDGFSDHTLGYDQTLNAVASGAKIIEKHVKLDHHDVTCPDANFAISMRDLKNMVLEIRRIEK